MTKNKKKPNNSTDNIFSARREEDKNLLDFSNVPERELKKEPIMPIVSESFNGTLESEFESVEGFDYSRALLNGNSHSKLDYTEDEEDRFKEIVPKGWGPESVCGNDTREELSRRQYTQMPFRSICHLLVTFPDSDPQYPGLGTGWFIGPRTVMTAGHCVYSHDNGGWASKIEVIPGRRGTNFRPFGSQIATVFKSVEGWIQNRDQEYDYGAIILDSDFGSRIGYFGFGSYRDSDFRDLIINLCGYPADKPYGTQWYNADKIREIQPRKIKYMLDSYGGQSGSPVWRKITNSSGNTQYIAVGIHAYGGCPNSATRITDEVLNLMNRWRNP